MNYQKQIKLVSQNPDNKQSTTKCVSQCCSVYDYCEVQRRVGVLK